MGQLLIFKLLPYIFLSLVGHLNYENHILLYRYWDDVLLSQTIVLINHLECEHHPLVPDPCVVIMLCFLIINLVVEACIKLLNHCGKYLIWFIDHACPICFAYESSYLISYLVS